MEVVIELVLSPFRDIVEKAQAAINNAGDSVPMLKAAQTLLKEGERALKRIEPICQKHLAEYGPGFVDILRENGKSGDSRGCVDVELHLICLYR